MSGLKLWQRALLLAAFFTLFFVPAYSYLATHDVERTVRQFTAGKHVKWPPPRKPAARGVGEQVAGALHHRVLPPLRDASLALLILALLLSLLRLRERRRRARELVTYELRLGRDDLANPYRVGEALEGIAGAIRARWQQRLLHGQDHFALEIHRLADGSIRFTIAAARWLIAAIAGPLEDLYPDVRLIEQPGRPSWQRAVTRLKKRSSHVLSLQTTRNYEHSFSESLVALLGKLEANTSVQVVLTPAPSWVHRRARRLLKRRERALQYADRRDPGELGTDSVVEAKELKGALETQHRSLLYFDLRIVGEDTAAVRRVAGLFAQLRSENELVRRDMRLRRRLYARRLTLGLPNPIPGLRTEIISTSELATLWQLPRARAKLARIPRSTMRRAVAPPEMTRDPALELLRDERGAVGIAPADRKFGHALIGGQGGGKTSALARHWTIAAQDRERAAVLIDGKGPLAEAAVGMVPPDRTLHYIDLAYPEIGFNPLHVGASPGATAAGFVQALVEANPPGAIQAASDSFLRQAIAAVCTVESDPTLWHVYRMLELGKDHDYRDSVVRRLDHVPGSDFARNYWHRDFRTLIGDKGYAAQALNPPRNKLERLISTRETDILLRHPQPLDLAALIERGEVLVVNAAKAHVGEDNARLIMQLLLQLLHRQVQAQQRKPEADRRRVSLLFDEAHNVLTPSVATMLAEGRSAGLEAVFAWQYTAQIPSETVRSGVRSLLQSISIFRMREMEDARSFAGLAMDVYSDRISVDHEDQERLRFSADDITRLQQHHAINLWIADGTPRPGFVAETLPWEELHDPRLSDHHHQAQRDRGGHCPPHLRDPLAAPPPADAPDTAKRSSNHTQADQAAHDAAARRSVSPSDDEGAKYHQAAEHRAAVDADDLEELE